MEYRATHGNGGIGFTTFTYEGRTGLGSPMIWAGFIIDDFYQDPVGEHINLKFQYKNELEEFWDMIKHTKYFKILPSEFKTKDGRNIQCRYNINHVGYPITIAQTTEDTVDVYRVSMDDVINSMSYKSILVNESFNDLFNLRRYESYQKRFQQLSLIDTIYKIIEKKEHGILKTKEVKNESSETEDIKEETKKDIIEDTGDLGIEYSDSLVEDDDDSESNEYKWGLDPELDALILKIYGKNFTLDDVRPETWTTEQE